MEQIYEAVRFYRQKKKPTVMKQFLTLEQAREFAQSYPTKRSGRWGMNSFVGFRKMGV